MGVCVVVCVAGLSVKILSDVTNSTPCGKIYSKVHNSFVKGHELITFSRCVMKCMHYQVVVCAKACVHNCMP